jgi:hypothetical protein
LLVSERSFPFSSDLTSFIQIGDLLIMNPDKGITLADDEGLHRDRARGAGLNTDARVGCQSKTDGHSRRSLRAQGSLCRLSLAPPLSTDR